MISSHTNIDTLKIRTKYETFHTVKTVSHNSTKKKKTFTYLFTYLNFKIHFHNPNRNPNRNPNHNPNRNLN